MYKKLCIRKDQQAIELLHMEFIHKKWQYPITKTYAKFLGITSGRRSKFIWMRQYNGIIKDSILHGK